MSANEFLPESEQVALSPRFEVARRWIGEFSQALRVRPPELQIGKYAAYDFVQHVMVLSAVQLRQMDDASLRIVLAHEMGHASRRWRCFFTTDPRGQVKEELAADRIAHRLTGCSIEAWDEAMRQAEATEESTPDDACALQQSVLQFRSRRLAAFIEAGSRQDKSPLLGVWQRLRERASSFAWLKAR